MHGYPNKPIRIHTSEVGSDVDILVRLIAQGISGRLGQPVIVDNHAGIIAIERVLKAPADGYTLLVFAQTHWTAPLMQNTGYDPVRDFSPITLAVTSPLCVVVHPSVAANSIEELIALAKARPGVLKYGSGLNGSASQFGAALFIYMAGVNVVRVPNTTSGLAAVKDLLIPGEVQFMIPSWGSAMPPVKSGKLRALAVTSAAPSAVAPGLPTVAASGLPGYEIVQTIGIFAPAKTPAVVINRLNQEIVKFLKTAEVKERLLDAGMEAVGSTPEELAAKIKSEMAKWGKVIKDVGIRAN